LFGFSFALAEDDPILVEVDTDDVLTDNFLGAGVQWSGYPWFDVSEEDWQKVFKRVDYMKMPFTRVMVDITTFFAGLDENGEPQYVFDCRLMQRVYKLLDYCQENDIIVMAGQWGAANTAIYSGGNWDFPVDGPLHARITVDYIDQLVNVKGYTCIKWYNLINEPNGSWSSCDEDWELWKRMIGSLHKEMADRNLLAKIQIAGPDDYGSGKWMDMSINDPQIRQQLGIYEEHRYALNPEIVKADFETYVRQHVDSIKEKDPGKQHFFGEIGFRDDMKSQRQMHVYNFWYGVSMVDMAVQIIRAGSSGALAWYLDDSMHWNGDSDGPLEEPAHAYENRKVWGMWNITGKEHDLPDDENLRPWFYPWAALSRNFPAGCQTLQTDYSNVEKLRATAAKIPADQDYHLSSAVVNNDDQKRTVKIVVPKAGTKLNLVTYEYFDRDKNNKVDAWPEVVDGDANDIFPTAANTFENVDLSSGLIVELPSKGVIILTTMEGGSPISLKN
ncbi:MAG: glycoside hydrolase family 5 protein, partial [Planctomycetes bacterium]|nr:glycoside hydrolase family 5 protein [Planctomycetota bacterium]